MNNSENPDFIIPIGLHKVSLVNLLKAFKNHLYLLGASVEVHSKSTRHFWSKFCTDRKQTNFGKCFRTRVVDATICEEDDCIHTIEPIGLVPIPWNIKLDYVGIVGKSVLYIEV